MKEQNKGIVFFTSDKGTSLIMDSEGMRIDENFIIRQEQPKVNLKFKQSGRYLVVDFGEVTGNEMELEIKGYDRIARTYMTDSL